MLKKAIIENFQIHKKSILEFCDGVNIISGPSDNGKTSVLRSLGLVINNRPSGYGFKPHNAKKNSETLITTEFDDGIIKRRKSDKIDEYVLNDAEPFTALNRGVPDEVSDFINISDYQFQEQLQSHFFVSSSPGERAKLLNDVNNLSIVTKSLTKINSIIKENELSIKKIDEGIKDTKQKIESLLYIDNANNTLTNIEKYAIIIEENKRKQERIKSFIYEFNLLNNKIKFNLQKLSNKDLLSRIEILITQINECSKRKNNVFNYIRDSINIKDRIEKLNNILTIKNIVVELNKLSGKCIIIKDKVRSLNNWIISVVDLKDKICQYELLIVNNNNVIKCLQLIEKIRINKDKIEKTNKYIMEVDKIKNSNLINEKKLKEYKKEREDFLNKFKNCPFCGK